MSKLKTLSVFTLGAIIGFGSCLYLARQAINDETLSNEISHLYLPISNFISFNHLSDKDEYCLKLKTFKSDIKAIKEMLAEAQQGYSFSPSLKIVSKYANGTVNEFEQLQKNELRHVCEKT